LVFCVGPNRNEALQPTRNMHTNQKNEQLWVQYSYPKEADSLSVNHSTVNKATCCHKM
jgi:hypothetical protein